MKSIIQENKSCYFCKSEIGLVRHHCLKGTARRRLAEADGLWIWICPYHHDMVHGKDGHKMDMKLKKTAESAWLKHNGKTIPEFIGRYGKNWL